MEPLGYGLAGHLVARIYDFKLSATVIAGQPVVASTVAGQGGFVTDPVDVDTLTNMVGLVLGASNINQESGASGTLTYSTTQGAANEGLVRVMVNPDMIISARVSGSATVGANLTRYTNDTANAAGTTFTDSDLSATSYDEGVAFIEIGNNVGLSRRITTYTGSTSFVVTVPFPRTLSVGETALLIPYRPAGTTTMRMTTDFTEADSSAAVGTGAGAACVALNLQDRQASYIHWVPTSTIF